MLNSNRLISYFFPLYWGRKKLISDPLHLRHEDIPDGKILKLRNGCQFYLHPTTPYFGIYYYGEREPVETFLFQSLVQPRNIVFDIGANFGWYTILSGHLVGPDGHVHCFEPIQKMYQELLKNISLNHLEGNCSANLMGLGKSAGMSVFYYWKDTGATLIQTLGRTETAEVQTLDGYCSDRQIEKIHFLKCDVEGAELDVFEGGVKTLSSPERPILLFENTCRRDLDLSKQAHPLTLLRDYGYTDFWKVLRIPRTFFLKMFYLRMIPLSWRYLRFLRLCEPFSPRHKLDRNVRSILAFSKSTHALQIQKLAF